MAMEMLAERQGQFDAAIIAAFGDPGLFAARELFDAPVIGMSEAAMLTALMLGKRFGIVSFTTQMGPWYTECVEGHGLTVAARAYSALMSPSRRSPMLRRKSRTSWLRWPIGRLRRGRM